jgi:hypothetical protein
MSLAFARKYRPKKLDQIVGQATVVRTLINAIKSNRLHHAYLFVGQFGSGKTTAARILAASENCETSPGTSPCCKCSVCQGVFDGTHTDVKEIDAANVGGIDEIRELKKEFLYNPVDGAKTKYYIIDECLPKEATIVVDGNDVPIGDLVEGAIAASEETQKVCYVRGRDMASGESIDRQILRYIKIPNDKQMYEIDIKDADGNVLTLRITGNHNVFVTNGSKVKAEDLKVGDCILLEKNNRMKRRKLFVQGSV